MGRWISTMEDLAMSPDRVEAAIAQSNHQAEQARRIDREHRDVQTSIYLERAVAKVPGHLL